MATSRATLGILAALATLALLVVGDGPRAQSAAPDAPERYRGPLRLVDSLAQAYRLDSALAVLRPVVRDARRRDRKALAFLLRTEASIVQAQGRDPSRPAREALQLAGAARDTATLMAALSMLGSQTLGHDGLEEPADEWLLRLAVERDDYRYEGLARASLAYDALNDGRDQDARRAFGRALELSRQAADWRGEIIALTGLGHAYQALGDRDRSRQSHREVVRIAGERKAWFDQGHAFDDLGALELVAGDPEAAVESYRRAGSLFQRVGAVREWISPASGTAIAQRHAGRYAESDSTLRALIAAADSLGDREAWGWGTAQLAQNKLLEGEFSAAAAIARGGLVARALPVDHRSSLAVALASALRQQDSTAAALAAFEREVRAIRGRLPNRLALDVAAQRGELLLELNRPREALDVWARARPLLAGEPTWRRLELLRGVARAERAAGRPDRARAALDEALEAWDQDGEVPADPDERGSRRSEGRALHALAAEVALLDTAGVAPEERAREVWDLLQRYKLRVLRELTLGPFRPDTTPARLSVPPLTLEALRGGVLREGEVLLDAAPGPTLFAITRDSVRVLQPGAAIESRLRSMGQIERRPERRPAGDLDSTAAGLGEALLGEVAGLIRSQPRILFSPDGGLPAPPLGAVMLPDSSGRLSPLTASHEIEWVPTATLLGALRAAGAGDTVAARLLAIAGQDPAGRALPGAVREVRGLAERFTGVDARIPADSGTATTEQLGAYAVLHLAALARVDDARPWHSGLLLGLRDRSGDDPYLRAARLAHIPMTARLVVLTRCEVVRGNLSGEGVVGLSTAFLSAGARAVVAPLWPVDDRTTARLLDAFYDALARGQTAAAALRSGQEELRRDPATAHPHHWAGFVLVGNGEVRAGLRAKPSWRGPAIVAGAVLVFAAALFAGGRRRRDERDRSS